MATANSTQIDLPSEETQAALKEWLAQVQRGEEGNPALLLVGLRASDTDRREVGIIDARLHPEDPSKIGLTLRKPAPRKDQPPHKVPWTEYWFDREIGWLLPVLAIYGNDDDIGVSPSKSGEKANRGKPNGYYCATIKFSGLAAINVDRLTSGVGPYQAAPLADPQDYHNRTQGNIKPTSSRKIAEKFGPENSRSPRRPLRTREDAIKAAVAQWREGGPFPSPATYEEALRFVFALLDRRPAPIAA